MVWRSGRAPSAGASGRSRGGASRAAPRRASGSASCEARVSSSESHPVRPPPAWAGLSEGASARRAGMTGAAAPVMSERWRAGSGRALPLAAVGSSRPPARGAPASTGSARRATASAVSIRRTAASAVSIRRAGSTASRPRPWRATMRLSSASASIWSTMTRRMWEAVSAVSCGSSRMPLRSSARVPSSSAASRRSSASDRRARRRSVAPPARASHANSSVACS